MSLKVPAIVSWDLDTVIARVDDLRSDAAGLHDSAAAVRSAAEQNLDGFRGDTASAATRGCSTLARDITILGRKAARSTEALADFCTQAPGLRAKLLAALDVAAAARCRVADDGTVRGPLLIGDPSDPEVISAQEKNDEVASDIEDTIQPLLRTLEELDRAAANALNLMSMTESYVSYPYDPDEVGIDPRTMTAGATLSLSTGATGFAADAMGASSAIVRGLPVFGTALNLALGFATSPEEESFEETLAIEAGGILAGAAATAAAGALAGSIVPGPGTVGGFALGALAGLAAGFGATHHLRDYAGEQRADGKENFGW